MLISIHVPAWGTTGALPFFVDLWGISIHVPAWGTTKFRQTHTTHWLFQSTFPRGERPECPGDQGEIINFNPRSRVGNDDLDIAYSRNAGISIHVPAWGTTLGQLGIRKPLKFQSTFPRGERPRCVADTMTITAFQSTFPRGERLRTIYFPLKNVHFNPRSRVGNDLNIKCSV